MGTEEYATTCLLLLLHIRAVSKNLHLRYFGHKSAFGSGRVAHHARISVVQSALCSGTIRTKVHHTLCNWHILRSALPFTKS